MSLDGALRSLNAGDWEGGLAALDALWASCRCPKLAAQIERLSAHALQAAPALEGEGKALQKAWEDRCAEGKLVGLERLLSVIREGTTTNMRARFDRLRERAPDPRMTMVVPLFANELHTRSAKPVWTAFFKLVGHVGDPRAKTPLQQLLRLTQKVLDESRHADVLYFEQWMVKQLTRALSKLPGAGAYDDVAKLQKAVDALVKRPFVAAEPAASDVEQLYEALLEKPDDEQALRVWTDALVEAGDDRGTFASLSLLAEERELTKAEAKQAAQLLKGNRLKWLGKAGSVIEDKTATFRRGLLDSARLARKCKPQHLQAPEFRSAAQLWAHEPALLGHDNLVSLRRLGTCAIPNPRSTTGLVGFDYPQYHYFDWEDTLALCELGLSRVTHLEMELPRNCDPAPVAKAFPGLDTVLVSYSWSGAKLSVFEPMFDWLATMKDVIFLNIMDSRAANDAHFVERLPSSNVHFVYGGGELYRSYVRRDGELHALFTDTSGKGGFSDGRRPGPDLDRWLAARMGFFSRLPAVDSLSFRQRSTWPALDVEALAKRTKKVKNVTLPKAKKAR